MNEEELKATIRCIHEAWYGDWLDDPATALKMHRHMEVLFNYAEIKSSLVKNNPDEMSPSQYAKLHGIKEGKEE